MGMTTRGKAAVGGVLALLAGLVLLALTTSPLFAQPPTPNPSAGPQSGTTLTHQQMDQMMDALHGQGTSQQMHEAMGPDAEKLMDQCVAMMNTMQAMQGMMGAGDASGMMNAMLGR